MTMEQATKDLLRDMFEINSTLQAGDQGLVRWLLHYFPLFTINVWLLNTVLTLLRILLSFHFCTFQGTNYWYVDYL